MKTLISNVRAVLLDGADTILPGAFVAVEDGKIASVGTERPAGPLTGRSTAGTTF